jgi:hypothetical protein
MDTEGNRVGMLEPLPMMKEKKKAARKPAKRAKARRR